MKSRFLFLTIFFVSVSPIVQAQYFQNGEYVIDQKKKKPFFIMNDEKRSVETQFLQNVFFEGYTPRLVDEMQLETLPTGEPVTSVMLAKGDDAAVYLVLNGNKHHVVSTEAFHFAGFSWPKIRQMNNRQIQSIKTGAPFRHDGPGIMQPEPLPCGNTD